MSEVPGQSGLTLYVTSTQQVRVMTALRHPNVVLFMAACTKPPTMCIVMEFMSLGSLYEVLTTCFLFSV